ncbi:hypothetical protein, variant 1 [Exophiala oligosperma]|uniref:Trichodiene oxygenase n=1 Tax=Exophiala oligosperma TaxID=215243 RepID=A0A0D2E0L6_9EURO|nr:hypothetical protein, variant 1 [Exophiala oligosperma]KIW48345.1 hypothetical protein, variant 1 [Exophiala oligosperma]
MLVESLQPRNWDVSALGAFLLLFLAWFTSQALLFLYRITIHPLARFPGPIIAGLTYWYEYYYDVSKEGRYLWKIIELHEKYGPIVRINPNEIHASDPSWFAEIYHGTNTVTDRDGWYNLDFLGDGLAFTLGHELHATRRAPLAPYFSAQSIRALEPRITGVVARMVRRLEEFHASGHIVNLYHMFAAYALDIVSEYALGEDGSTNLMGLPEMGRAWSEMTTAQIRNNPLGRHFKSTMRVMLFMPEWVLVRLVPGLDGFVKYQDSLLRQTQRVLTQNDTGEGVLPDKRTILHELAASPTLPPREKSLVRLKDEMNMVIGAGGETTAQTLTRTCYHLVTTPDVLARLKRELTTTLKDPDKIPSIDLLQNLRYLTAVVEEGLRISFPVLARSPRVFRRHALQLGDWTVPAGKSFRTRSNSTRTDGSITRTYKSTESHSVEGKEVVWERREYTSPLHTSWDSYLSPLSYGNILPYRYRLRITGTEALIRKQSGVY